MSSDTQRIRDFQRRVTMLYQAYGEIDDLEGGPIKAEVRDIDNLQASVRAATLGAVVEAEEEWGGIEQAPQAYRIALCDLRDLRQDLITLRFKANQGPNQ